MSVVDVAASSAPAGARGRRGVVRLVTLAARSAACQALFRARGIGGGPVTCEGRLPVVHAGGRVRLGRLALRGTVAPVELGATAGGELVLGERVFVNSGASLVAAARIEVGDDARIGDFAAVLDSDHHPVEQGAGVRAAPVRIGANAWLGRGAVVLPGVTIGEHAVVAAGAVLTADVPPRTLVAGNPARVVRELRAEEGWRRT